MPEQTNKILVTTIKRGDSLEGHVFQRTDRHNKLYVELTLPDKSVKEDGPYDDQDEAEMRLSAMMDDAWRGHYKLPPRGIKREI